MNEGQRAHREVWFVLAIVVVVQAVAIGLVAWQFYRHVNHVDDRTVAVAVRHARIDEAFAVQVCNRQDQVIRVLQTFVSRERQAVIEAAVPGLAAVNARLRAQVAAIAASPCARGGGP